MRIEHYNLEKLKKEILEIIGKHLDLNDYKVFFFGSRVLGKGDERSDIDIGIEGEKSVPSGPFMDIVEDIANLPTLYKVDVVDFKQLAPNFYKIAKQKAEYLN